MGLFEFQKVVILILVCVQDLKKMPMVKQLVYILIDIQSSIDNLQ
jgi:hypothetical protein